MENQPIVSSKRNKRLGLLWLIGPTCLLVVILAVFGIVTFIADGMDPTRHQTALALIRVILGFLGIIDVILIMVGIPVGIIYLNKKAISDTTQYDERSGKGDASIIPPEISGWNWGAGFLTWIWGAYYGVWLSFLAFVPLLNLVWWIVLGIKGNEWAWRNNKWISVEQFKQSQKKWVVWGVIMMCLQILGLLLGFLNSNSN